MIWARTGAAAQSSASVRQVTRAITAAPRLACGSRTAVDNLAAAPPTRQQRRPSRHCALHTRPLAPPPSHSRSVAAPALDPRITERRNPRSANVDLASPLEIVDLMNAEDQEVPRAVAAVREHVARAIELAEATFRGGGRLIYAGAGTSGRLGVLDASECPPTFGVDPEMVQGIIAGGYAALTRAQEGAEDSPEAGAAAVDERRTTARDFVVGIAASGTTPYV